MPLPAPTFRPQFNPVYNRMGYMQDPSGRQLGTARAGGQSPLGVWRTAMEQPRWSAESFLQQRGLPTTTPSGQYLGGARNLGELATAVQRNYGTSLAGWTGMPSEERTAMFNRLNRMQMDQIFDPETGLPTRTPRTAQEAQQFQLEAARRARLMQQTQLREALSTLQEGVGLAREDLAAHEAQRGRALSTLRYGLGLTQRSSPYSLAAMMSPLLSQQAQTHMQMPQNLAGAAQPYLGGQAAARMSMQYEPSDFSYFLRPEAQAAAGGAPRVPYYAVTG